MLKIVWFHSEVSLALQKAYIRIYIAQTDSMPIRVIIVLGERNSLTSLALKKKIATT